MDRPAQFYGTAASGATNGNTDAYGNVQFSNPWSGPAGARAGAAVNPTSAPYGLPATTMAPQSDLSALRAPLRQNSVSTSFDNLALTAPLVSRSMSSQNPLYATDNFPTAGYGTTYGDTQAATAATASPSAGATYAAINGYGAYDNGSNQKLYSLPNLSSLPEDHRRLSHASLASSSAASSIMDSPLDPLRQRQSSLVDYTRGSLAGSYPSAEMDSARGMVHLSQNATRFSIPNGHRSSSSASSSSYYPHSTSSSISSASSYPYYGAGSIDSGTDMTGLGLYDDPSRPSLPRPHGMLHTMNHGGYPATQQQMMHSFNSKIQQSTTKKHKCKVCDKRFTRPSSLQTHMYSHTGEKPFACEVEGCGRQFSVVSNLRRHRKVHKGHSDTETVSNAGSV